MQRQPSHEEEDAAHLPLGMKSRRGGPGTGSGFAAQASSAHL